MFSLIKIALLAAVATAQDNQVGNLAATPIMATPIAAKVPSAAAAYPSGAFTPVFNARIHPKGDAGKCLDVREHKFENGTPVQIWDCGAGAPDNQVWRLNGGRTEIRVTGTDFCLDVGNEPLNNGNMVKIWRCHGGPQQRFDYGRDGRIRIPGKNVCIDLTDGNVENGTPVQIYGCGDQSNNNQYFPSREVRRWW